MSNIEYIQHHLSHLSYNIKTNSFSSIGFWSINLDTVFFSFILGIITLFIMYFISNNAKFEHPGYVQSLLEIIVEFIDNQTKDFLLKNKKFIGSLSLTIFIWIFVMNFMDIIPIDFFPFLLKIVKIEKCKIVPTSDINMTFALSISIFLLTILHSIKKYGVKKFVKTLIFYPFNNIILIPFNLLLSIVEMISKPISLSLRLFGNLYAGELIFILINLFTVYTVQRTISYTTTLIIAQILLGTIWSIFHIFVIILQAFIFMILTIIYLTNIHES